MTPWLGRPTLYASGYMRHQRTSAASQSLSCALSSPPTYCTGFCTRGSRGSSRGKSESMRGPGYVAGPVAVCTLLALAGCSPGARRVPPPTAPAAVAFGDPVVRDMDGDGDADAVTLVRQGDDQAGRWGVRAELSRLG